MMKDESLRSIPDSKHYTNNPIDVKLQIRLLLEFYSFLLSNLDVEYR